jgi:protein TonB
LHKRQAELEAEQQRLLTRLQAKRQVSAQHSTADARTEAQSPGHTEVDQDSVVLNAQIAALAERIERDNPALRRAYIAPSAMQAVYAAYVDAWRTRIENVGTRHFPVEARGGRGETLRMTVTLAAEGHVLQTHIDQPASNPALNLAARRIVQLAAPFPPFPPELASTTKRLTITRNWHFLNDTLDTSAP